jgi:hypothetical protein
MLRSFVVMILAGVTSIPLWVEMLRTEPFYAVASGFTPGDTPGVGTFYDFQNRLLGGPPQPVTRRPTRLTPAKKKELKEAKKRPSRKHEGIVARLAQHLLGDGRHVGPLPVERLLNDLLQALCVEPSVTRGLLTEQVGVSGDGAKVATFANSYGEKACACKQRGCGCPRRFHDAEATTGYDAYHNRFVFGHTLYALTAWSPDEKVELPIYLMRATGHRSDCVLGPLALDRARRIACLEIEKGCFDGAHDAGAFYDLGLHWQIALFIPLAGAPRKEEGPGDGGQDRDGTPLCRAGRRMVADGYQPEYRRYRWRCPLKKGAAKGDVTRCPEYGNCSQAAAGRIVYTHPEEDPRLQCVPPRGTPGWQTVYNHRTASERSFARALYHLGLDRTRTRGGDRWFFRFLITVIAHYLITWHQHRATP